jgi:guanylate kinase
MTKGKIAILAGPSGVGKDTLIKLFLDKHPEWEQPRSSTTTRKPRIGEDKDALNFVTPEVFEDWKRAGKFLETDFHAQAWYGTLREPVEQVRASGKNALLRIDVNGAVEVKRQIPETIMIFLKAENFETLEQRFRDRKTENEDQIENRLKLAKHELTFEPKFEHVIINRADKLADTLKDLEEILCS